MLRVIQLHTVCRVGACEDRAAGDVGTFADEVVIALTLCYRRLGAFTVNSCQRNREILKQNLRSRRCRVIKTLQVHLGV